MKVTKSEPSLFIPLMICCLLVGILNSCFNDSECRSGNIPINQFAIAKTDLAAPDSSLPSDFKFTVPTLLIAVLGNWFDTAGSAKMQTKAIAGALISYNLATENEKCGATRTATSFSCITGGQEL